MNRCEFADTHDCPEVDIAEANSDYLLDVGFGWRYGVPDEAQLFGGATEAEESAAIIRGYWGNIAEHLEEGEGFLVCGTVGTGKTFALALTALAARRFVTGAVRYTYAPALFGLLHQRGEDAAAPYRVAELLLLDDFGAQYTSEWGTDSLNAFIEYRHANGLTTCVTTNRTPDGLKAMTEFDRVIDRWREQCKGRVVEVAGESLRGDSRGADG